MRLIDADALKKKKVRCTERHEWAVPLVDIENAPTIEERKSGKWIPIDIPWYQCSECGAVREHKSFMENFCPNCGAKMES